MSISCFIVHFLLQFGWHTRHQEFSPHRVTVDSCQIQARLRNF
ncbi:hypothetical protein DAI22_12g192601 [Oryza sativa Japonica Group]|nr:hypothetical protein DAI22_12g192601 [Oryza sativa Japonica Group]